MASKYKVGDVVFIALPTAIHENTIRIVYADDCVRHHGQYMLENSYSSIHWYDEELYATLEEAIEGAKIEYPYVDINTFSFSGPLIKYLELIRKLNETT